MQRESLPIIYEDDDYVAIHKPSGLLVHRSEIDRRETRFAVQILRDQLKHRVYPVHRLDKPTSGVLLFAKSKEALVAASAQFENHAVKKTYIAFVRGHTQETLTIDHPVKAREDVRDQASFGEPKDAITELKRLAQYQVPVHIEKYPQSRFSLVELTPKTGRRHQLRHHMKHISHPIIGDSSYGRGQYNRYFAEHFDCCRLLLCATQLELQHPIEKRDLVIRSEISEDFQKTLDLLDRWKLANT